MAVAVEQVCSEEISWFYTSLDGEVGLRSGTEVGEPEAAWTAGAFYFLKQCSSLRESGGFVSRLVTVLVDSLIRQTQGSEVPWP